MKTALSTSISMYCYGMALGNNPGPVAESGIMTDPPMPLSCTTKRMALSPGLKGDHHQRSELLERAYGS